MKVRLLVTDELGKTFGGEVVLSQISNPDLAEIDMRAVGVAQPNFGLGERAFAKTYANRRSGPEIFTLLVAYLAKGDEAKRVPVKDIQVLWGRMTSVLGMAYNGKYPTVAKEYGWIDAPERGKYVITAAWPKSCENANVA